MDFTELKNSLSEVKKVYLLEGEDAFFRNRGIELIKKKVLTEPDFNLSNFEGSSLKGNGIDLLTSALLMCPFLGDYRVVFVNEWYPTLNDFKNKELSAFFNSELRSTVLIVSNKSKCEAIKKQSATIVVDCKKADARLISRYIQAEAGKANLIVSKTNCDLIAEFCNFDMSKICVETAKLIGFSIGNTEIDEKTINELVTKETDYKIYEIVNFVAQKNFNKAYEIINEMLDLGNRQILFVSLFNHFRRLLAISLSKETDSQLADMLGVKEYAIKKSREQARCFSPKRLIKINESLIDYDAKFKSGEIGFDAALNNALFQIMTEN